MNNELIGTLQHFYAYAANRIPALAYLFGGTLEFIKNDETGNMKAHHRKIPDKRATEDEQKEMRQVFEEYFNSSTISAGHSEQLH